MYRDQRPLRTEMPVGTAVLPTVDELIDTFTRARLQYEIARTAERLGDTGHHAAVRPLLARLSQHEIQRSPDLERAVCSALAKLGVMHVGPGGRFALRPRHLLAADVVDMVTEMDAAIPLRYFLVRQV